MDAPHQPVPGSPQPDDLSDGPDFLTGPTGFDSLSDSSDYGPYGPGYDDYDTDEDEGDDFYPSPYRPDLLGGHDFDSDDEHYTPYQKAREPPANGVDYFSALPVELHLMIANQMLPTYGHPPHFVRDLATLLLASSHLRRVYHHEVCKILAAKYIQWWKAELDRLRLGMCWDMTMALTEAIVASAGFGVDALVEILRIVEADEVSRGFQAEGIESLAQVIAAYAMKEAIVTKKSEFVVGLVDKVGRTSRDWFGNGAYEDEWVVLPGRRIVRADRFEFVELLAKRAGLNLWELTDHNGKNGLHMAIIFRSSKTVRSMLDLGADIHSKDNEGWQPIHTLACLLYDSEFESYSRIKFKEAVDEKTALLKMLIDAGADVNNRIPVPLFPALSFEQTLIEQRLTNSSPLDLVMFSGMRRWRDAMAVMRASLVLVLLENGAVPSEKPDMGHPGYMHTVAESMVPEEQLIQILQAFLDKGVDPNFKSKYGNRTALHVAASRPLPLVFKWLIAHGANPDQQDDKGVTPINRLVSHDSTDDIPTASAADTETRVQLLHHLAQTGYDFNKDFGVDSLFFNGLNDRYEKHGSCYCSFKKRMVEAVIELGARIHIGPGAAPEDRRCGASWHRVLKCNIEEESVTEFYKLLFDNGADIQYLSSAKGSPLINAAISKDRISLTKLLIEKGALLNSPSPTGLTALHSACFRGNFELVQLLIENGADVNETDHLGRSSVHYAVMIPQSISKMIKKGFKLMTFIYMGGRAFTKLINENLRVDSKIKILTHLHKYGANMNLHIPSRIIYPTTFDTTPQYDRDLFDHTAYHLFDTGTYDDDDYFDGFDPTCELVEAATELHKTRRLLPQSLPPISLTLRCPHNLRSICTFNKTLTLHLLTLGANPHTGTHPHNPSTNTLLPGCPTHIETGYLCHLLDCDLPRPTLLSYLSTLLRTLGPTDLNTPIAPKGATALIHATFCDSTESRGTEHFTHEDNSWYDHDLSRLLLAHGADPWQKDTEGWNAVMNAGCFKDAVLAGLLCGDEEEGREWAGNRLKWDHESGLGEAEVANVFNGVAGWWGFR